MNFCMSKKVIFIGILIVIAIAFIVFHGGMPGSSGEGNGARQNETPTFALADYDGNIIDTKDFKGKIQVLNAWASWCPFCVDELPDFGELQEAFPEDVVVVAVNRAEPTSIAKDFSDKLGLSDTYIFLIDPSDTFYKSIGGFSMPETLFLDKKGKLVQHKRGPLTFEDMKEIVERVLENE